MDELIKLLDKNLQYVDHEILDDTIHIHIISTRKEVVCPYCQKPSSKIHSHYERSFQDLPIQGKKVKIILNNRKMFCVNPECDHTTFAETFEFLPFKSKKTKRLEDEIINVAMNVSSLAATAILKNSVVDISKSTVCYLLKKKQPPN